MSLHDPDIALFGLLSALYATVRHEDDITSLFRVFGLPSAPGDVGSYLASLEAAGLIRRQRADSFPHEAVVLVSLTSAGEARLRALMLERTGSRSLVEAILADCRNTRSLHSA